MDYMKFVEYHRDQGADITVGCLPVDYERASDFGLMNIDNEGVVTVSSCLHGCAAAYTSCMVAIQIHVLGAHVLPALVYPVEEIQHSHAVLHLAYLQMRQASLVQEIAALDVQRRQLLVSRILAFFADLQSAAMQGCSAISVPSLGGPFLKSKDVEFAAQPHIKHI